MLLLLLSMAQSQTLLQVALFPYAMEDFSVWLELYAEPLLLVSFELPKVPTTVWLDYSPKPFLLVVMPLAKDFVAVVNLLVACSILLVLLPMACVDVAIWLVQDPSTLLHPFELLSFIHSTVLVDLLPIPLSLSSND